MIGGESGKCRPSWIGVFCDWSRGGEKEAIFAQIWAVSFMGDVTGSGSENTGSGSQNVKMFYLVRKICLSEFLQAGTWARTECHGGRPIFVTQRNNVTDVLLGLLPGGRDGLGSRGPVLCRRGLRFHRVCRIVGRTERLEQWQVDLVV